MTEEFKVVPKLRPLDIMRGRFDLMKSELSTTMTMCKTKVAAFCYCFYNFYYCGFGAPNIVGYL